MMHSLAARYWLHGADAALNDQCPHCSPHGWHGLPCSTTTACGCLTSWEPPTEDGAA